MTLIPPSLELLKSKIITVLLVWLLSSLRTDCAQSRAPLRYRPERGFGCRNCEWQGLVARLPPYYPAISYTWRELVAFRRFVVFLGGLQLTCCLSLPLRLFCFISLRLFTRIEPAAPRSIFLRYACMRPGSHTQLVLSESSFVLFLFFVEVALFPIILYRYRFIFLWRVLCTFPFWVAFFYFVTKCSAFISAYLRISSINQGTSFDIEQIFCVFLQQTTACTRCLQY